MNYRVYLSYSPKDSEIAKDLARRLSEVGVQVSHATDKVETHEAEVVRRRIRECMKGSNEVIVLLTDTSANSPWVRYEMGAADALDVRVTPVVVHDGVEQLVPMVGKNFIKYADLPKYISSLKRRAKAA
jgi:hypothetical protein